MKSSPMMIRIAELRMRSAPMIGPTVRTLRGSPAPKRASSSFSRFANSVPSASGAGLALGEGAADPDAAPADADALGLALASGDALGDADGLPLADGAAEADPDGEALADAEPDAPAEPDGDGAAVSAGIRSIGSGRMRRRPLSSSVTRTS